MECAPLGLAPSFGFGDRIGLATAGHAQAMLRFGAGMSAIFAQQSIREMQRTGRTPEQVMADAAAGARGAGYRQVAGADADHLKTFTDIESTAAAGFTFFTIDPSDHVDQRADTYDASMLRARYDEVAAEVGWVEAYRGRTVRLTTGAIVGFDGASCQRCAVKYGRALNHTLAMAARVADVCGRRGTPGSRGASGTEFEIEISVDETEYPTSLAEHYIVADQCRLAGVELVSLAPRFAGTFEKGVDYIGELSALEASLCDHAAIAELLGPYKLSLHSGSDKLSVYPPLARATAGRFHIKTAGTSYLEALRVLATADVSLFRELCEFARGRYDEDRATYHVHATLDTVPPPRELNTEVELLRVYLDRWEDMLAGGDTPSRGFVAAGRQILHCTFGSVLGHPRFGLALRECLRQNQDAYDDVLLTHFGAHLRALQECM